MKIPTPPKRFLFGVLSKKYRVFLSASIVIPSILLLASLASNHSEETASSPEIGFTSVSPSGKQGGVAVPASCASSLHDDPWYGTVCTACNTCGTCASGTLQCSGTPEYGKWSSDSSWWGERFFNEIGLSWTEIGIVNPSGFPGACSVGAPANPWYLGVACSASNACGSTNWGTYDCAGNCSVGAPALPVGYESACTSAANNCGSTNPGVIGCSGCSAAAPADIALGTACSGPVNACGMTIAGTIGCSGCSSTVAPANTLCDLAVCKNGCTSTIDRSGSFTIASGSPSTTLKACFYQAGTSACASGVDVTGSATWTETNAPKNAISFSSTGILNTRFVNGDEVFRVSYGGVTKSPRVTVTCIPNTCSIPDAKAKTDTYCPETVQDTGIATGCDGETLTCPGTRHCDYNVKEVSP